MRRALFIATRSRSAAPLASRPARRLASTFDASDFTAKFLAEVQDVPAATCPTKSSAALRSLVKSEVLKFTDMRDEPEKFFLAHRLLATIGLGGFGVRFTVQVRCGSLRCPHRTCTDAVQRAHSSAARAPAAFLSAVQPLRRKYHGHGERAAD
jgi:hypothetical protein